ncbi:NAD(P)H-dependent flavin oxidoreductase [Desertibacillus haloalkaliphilus]|uniref:NAD(P)H-dependent flavin oxidoreductase n=1 Tax=Desertibacillus haloalkaliphilus TaxID=1328930 RepID=UPI001C252CBB|nr:nitronate monooxygenase [Desertibacillus haloalkaliphilus]MBU8906456.1 nitronate monooxygenase [Desertibacillus haloalkaliphilus]
MNILCRKLGLEYPMLQGGMGNVSHPNLTAAISEAGGLGTLGAGTMTPAELEEKIIGVKEKTDKAFCMNIPITVQPYFEEIVDLVFKHKIPVVSLSAGNPVPLIPKFQEKGIKVICVVASVKQAIKVDRAGADVIVGEGYEAAGINSNFETTTLTLIPQIVNVVEAPVVAAGGIGDGRGLLAMLSLGASGVQMGTRFIATKEALVHDNYKQLITDAGDTDTVIVGRSVGRVRRLLNTEYANKLIEAELQGVTLEEFNEKTNEDCHIAGAIEGKLAKGHVNGGQVAGLIEDIPSVSDLLEDMMKQATAQNEAIMNNFVVRK